LPTRLPGGDPNNRRNVWQSDLAGEPVIAVEPVDLAGDGDGSLLDAAMTLVCARCAFETGGGVCRDGVDRDQSSFETVVFG
jgi:hypothetical protein